MRLRTIENVVFAESSVQGTINLGTYRWHTKKVLRPKLPNARFIVPIDYQCGPCRNIVLSCVLVECAIYRFSNHDHCTDIVSSCIFVQCVFMVCQSHVSYHARAICLNPGSSQGKESKQAAYCDAYSSHITATNSH